MVARRKRVLKGVKKRRRRGRTDPSFPKGKKRFRALSRQSGGSFMDKKWWERLGKNMANTAVTMGTLGMADVPYKDV